ncbi:MAG: hypothetical protein COB10_11585 [Planctomycetota bacterium]|nr:MAG: hypothetical protein COB10_11585 [Planctomycetota bacterium]
MTRKSNKLHQTTAKEWRESLIDFCRACSLLWLVVLSPNATLPADQPQETATPSQLTDLATERKVLREMIIEGRAQTALERIQSLQTTHTSDSGLMFLAGEAFYALEQLQEAVMAFEAGLELNPSKKGQLFNLGRALQALGRDEQALLVFNHMQKRPEASFQTRGLFGAGLSQLNLGKEQTARNLFVRSLQLDPTFDRARYRLSLLLLHQDPAESLSMLETILARDPLHHGSAYNRALALRNLGRSQQATKAMAHYRRILEGRSRIALLRERWAVAPLDIELMLELGRVHRELGAIAEALRWYSRGGLAAPTDPRPAVESVRTLLVVGRRAEAMELVKRLQGTAAAIQAQQLLESSKSPPATDKPTTEDH